MIDVAGLFPLLEAFCLGVGWAGAGGAGQK